MRWRTTASFRASNTDRTKPPLQCAGEHKTRSTVPNSCRRAQAAGLAAQEQAAVVSRGAQVFMPVNPVAATGAALGAGAAGYVTRVQARRGQV